MSSLPRGPLWLWKRGPGISCPPHGEVAPLSSVQGCVLELEVLEPGDLTRASPVPPTWTPAVSPCTWDRPSTSHWPCTARWATRETACCILRLYPSPVHQSAHHTHENNTNKTNNYSTKLSPNFHWHVILNGNNSVFSLIIIFVPGSQDMFDMTRTFDYARTEGPGHEVFTVTDRTRLTGVTRRAALPPPLVTRQRTPLTPHH